MHRPEKKRLLACIHAFSIADEATGAARFTPTPVLSSTGKESELVFLLEPLAREDRKSVV
jgi:hypothetical protein